jgi:hypothetical protein
MGLSREARLSSAAAHSHWGSRWDGAFGYSVAQCEFLCTASEFRSILSIVSMLSGSRKQGGGLTYTPGYTVAKTCQADRETPAPGYRGRWCRSPTARAMPEHTNATWLIPASSNSALVLNLTSGSASLEGCQLLRSELVVGGVL